MHASPAFSPEFFPAVFPAFSPHAVLSLAALALLLSLMLGRLVVSLPRQIDAVIEVNFSLRQRLLFSTVCMALGAVCGWRWGLTFTGLAAAGFVVLLTVLGWTDALSGLLPDMLTLSLLWLGLLVNLGHTFASLPDAVWGAVAGYAFFWLLYHTFLRLTQREGLGYGDLKLLAAMGAWLGWEPLMLVVALASACGVGITMLRCWRPGADMRNMTLAFGPYLAASGIFQLFWLFWRGPLQGA